MTVRTYDLDCLEQNFGRTWKMNHNQQSSEARHDDDAALSEFLASLMDYTPTVSQ